MPDMHVIEQAVTLAREGHTTQRIAAQLGLDRATVRDLRRLAGIPPIPRSAWGKRTHPRAAEIEQLLRDGLSNAAISRATGAATPTVARHRRAAGIPPYTQPPAPVHPRAEEIRALLPTAGDKRIASLVGADRNEVARLRRLYGPARPPARTAYSHPRAEEIRELLAAGHTNAAISRATGVDPQTVARHRRAAGIGPAPIPRATRSHPRADEIRALLSTETNAAISRLLGVHRSTVAHYRKATSPPRPAG
ncbi:hypothetical protein ACFYNV_29115 [Streptomyces albidoflavus]